MARCKMKIVACEILRSEVESIAPEVAGRATWLPAGLHVNLDRLGEALAGALTGAGRAVCLYGACHPDIDALVAPSAGCRLPGKDCISAFVTDEERRELEGRKAFVMTPGWLRHWREIFQEGQGWDEVDARQNFGFYDVVILLDFGLEPIDDLAVLEFFEYTQTPVEIVPASLDRFRKVLQDVIESDIVPADPA
jgi:hypothetical protein